MFQEVQLRNTADGGGRRIILWCDRRIYEGLKSGVKVYEG